MSKQETAFERTPPEIWSQIFNWATQWGDMPGAGNEILRDITFMWYECDRFHRYLKADYTRQRLRLVCRSWNQALQAADLDKHLVITDFDTFYWPSQAQVMRASYIEFVTSRNYCKCRLFSWRYGEDWEQLEELAKIPRPSFSSTRSSLNPDSGRIKGPLPTKVLLAERCNEIPKEILEDAPQLELLSWHPRPGDRIQFILCHLKNLTHLSLWRITSDHLEQMRGSFTIKPLKYLRLDIWPTSDDTIDLDPTHPARSMSTWTFPRLMSLMITGLLNSQMKEDAEVLASRCADHITCLIFSFQWSDPSRGGAKWWEGDPETWTLFPGLTTFGVTLDWFITPVGAPQGPSKIKSHGLPMTVVIYDFSIRSTWSGATARNCARNLVEWCSSHPGRIRRIAILQSWRDLTKNIARQQADSAELYGNILSRTKLFFDEIIDGNIPFCDRNGADLMDDDEAWAFIDGLNNRDT